MISLKLNPRQIFSRFDTIAAGLNVEKFADAAAASQLNRIRARFLAGEDTEGTPWLVSRAALKRRASGRGGGTLFNTGTLFHSIGIKRVGVGERSIGTDISYARQHQEGLQGMVRREFIGASVEDRQKIFKTTTLLVNTVLRRR